MRSSRACSAATAFGLFLLLAVIHTWPLASSPSRLSRNDNADTILNEWIVAWVAHEAPHAPRHLFDGNMFYPERGVLAYSEYLIVPAILGAPLLWAGASPVLVYNLLVLIGFALTGWSAWLLVSRWTGDWSAGVVAGTIIAFNAHTLTRLPQLQALHMEFLLFALLALDALLKTGGVRESVLLAFWWVLQGLTSYYGLVLSLAASAAGWIVRPGDWLGQHGGRRWLLFGAAGALAGIGLLPFLYRYVQVGQVRTLDEVASYSAQWRDYLASPARVHYGLWSARWFGGTTALFPGAVALVLAAVAVAGGAWRNPRARMAMALGGAGMALSFGPAMPGYATLYHWLPALQGIRNAARFGYLSIVSCGILAGFGLAALRDRCPTPGWRRALTCALFIGANLDAFAAPLEYVEAERVSPLYSSLRNVDAVVAEFPFFQPDRVFHNAPYLLDATRHWRPMLNGYSGLTPESYVAHALELAHFPDARSIAALRAAGVTHVFVHERALRDWTDSDTAAAVRVSPGLRRVAADGDLSLYEVVRPSSP